MAEPPANAAASRRRVLNLIPINHFKIQEFDRQSATAAPLSDPSSVVNAVTLVPLPPIPGPSAEPSSITHCPSHACFNTSVTPEPSPLSPTPSTESTGSPHIHSAETPSAYTLMLGKLSPLPNSDRETVRLYTTLNILYPKRSEDPEILSIILSQCECLFYSNTLC